MTFEDLTNAFNDGFCLGVDRSHRLDPKRRWFWVRPHMTPANGYVPYKCGWGSYYEDPIWDQMRRDPAKWKIGEERNGEFCPL